MSTEKKEGSNEIDRVIDSIRLHSQRPANEYAAEKSVSRLMARIEADKKTAIKSGSNINRYRVWLVAATVALLVAMSGWVYTMLSADDSSFIVAKNSTGIVMDVPLPDGTTIKLNNHSTLIYPEKFAGNFREVFLEGEAYFDVAHSKNHPFVVRAGKLTIKVLGTKFTVNAYSQSSEITTTLLEGSVDVSCEKEHILMKPDQQLKYNQRSGKVALAELTNASREIRWIENMWVLTETPLLEICQRLERQFNVNLIIMNDQLIDKSFTGEFYTNESLESILKTMQTSTPFHYERKGENIIIK